MSPLKQLAGVSLLAVFLSGCPAGSADTNTVTTSNPDLVDVRSEILEQVESGKLPSMSVAVAQNGTVIWLESFGWQDLANNIPATPSTIYAIGSVAKSITATGVMVQVDSGKLRLEQSVNEIVGTDAIQSNGGDADEITVRDVLSMTAGIPHGWVGVQAEAAKVRPSLKRVVHDYSFVAFPPGKVFEYSNYSMGIAEYMLEKSSGISFPEYMRAEVFEPLGMKNTSMGEEPRNKHNFAQRYTSALDLVEPSYFTPSGGGGAFSSAEDLLAFGLFHLGNRKDGQPVVLSDEALNQMHYDRSASENTIGAGPGWGLGMASVTLDDGYSWFMSNGSVGGGNAIVIMYPEENVVIACLTNRTGAAADQVARRIAETLIENYNDKFAVAIERWHASLPSPYQPSDKMTGRWVGQIHSDELTLPISLSFDETGEIRISLDGGESITVQDPKLGGGRLHGLLNLAAPNHIIGPKFSNGETDVKLIVADNELQGYLSVRFQTGNINYSIPVYIALKKDESRSGSLREMRLVKPEAEIQVQGRDE